MTTVYDMDEQRIDEDYLIRISIMDICNTRIRMKEYFKNQFKYESIVNDIPKSLEISRGLIKVQELLMYIDKHYNKFHEKNVDWNTTLSTRIDNICILNKRLKNDREYQIKMRHAMDGKIYSPLLDTYYKVDAEVSDMVYYLKLLNKKLQHTFIDINEWELV